MLPPRAPKKEKRDSRWRSPAHRAFVRTQFGCAMCGSMTNRQFAHVRMGSGAGMSQKPDDWRGVVLCADCHNGDQHTKMGEPSFWAEYERVHGQTVWQLIDAFCNASPKAREIRQVRNG